MLDAIDDTRAERAAALLYRRSTDIARTIERVIACGNRARTWDAARRLGLLADDLCTLADRA